MLSMHGLSLPCETYAAVVLALDDIDVGVRAGGIAAGGEKPNQSAARWKAIMS